MSKQPPEDSFKDKILRQLDQQETTTSGSSPKIEKSSRQESVGSRRTQASKPKGAPVKKRKPTATAEKKAVKRTTSNNNSDNPQKRKQTREQENKIVSKIVTVIVLALLVIGTVLGIYVYNFVSSGLKPLDASSKKEIAVEIPIGSSNKQIGEILEKDKVIKSGMVFNYYTKFNNVTGFQAGTFNFSPSMTLEDISNILRGGGAGTVGSDVKVTIPEGYTIDQIGDAIAEKTKIKKADFIALMQDQTFFDKLHAEYPQLLDSAAAAEGVRYRLEGYLFPATYDYYKSTNLESMVTQMVDKSNTVMAGYYDTIAQKGLTVQQVLTLASLVEKEGVTEEDRKKIAQVFFNRLAIDMPLQSDISILYALGEHKERVLNKDTEVDSPYNLYVNTGYGPGPFDSPSEMAIKAVLEPTPTDDYYFVADIHTGKVYYSKTFEEHQVLVDEYVNK